MYVTIIIKEKGEYELKVGRAWEGLEVVCLGGKRGKSGVILFQL